MRTKNGFHLVEREALRCHSCHTNFTSRAIVWPLTRPSSPAMLRPQKFMLLVPRSRSNRSSDLHHDIHPEIGLIGNAGHRMLPLNRWTSYSGWFSQILRELSRTVTSLHASRPVLTSKVHF